MDPWLDPKESTPEAWGRSEDDPDSVNRRAHAATRPYERTEGVTLAGPNVSEVFETASYDHAKLHYTVGVDAAGRVELLSKGHLWGEGETHQRFRVQYRRPAEPTRTDPFDTHSAWVRFRTGTVRQEDSDLRFEAGPAETEERTMTLGWGELFRTDRLRLAEAELVRNPPLARYALMTVDAWADVRDTLRYHVPPQRLRGLSRRRGFEDPK